MGKIYEALNRSESEGGPSRSPLRGIEEGRPSDGRPSEGQPEKFNFVRYSLGAPSIMEKDRANREAASQAIARRSIAQPGLEVTVSPAQIDPHLVSFYNFDRAASEQYNRLALTLISRAAERGVRRVLVASAQHGEGRTSVALNLACALARAKQRVLVIDCDLLQPSVTGKLGIGCELGMAEAFRGGMAPGAAVLRILPYGFSVLPTSKRVENPLELLAAPGFWKMLQTFDVDYDFILFDSSPLLSTGDSSLLIRFTDTTLLVVRQGHTSSSQMAKAIAPFSRDDILGVVI
ncbi:MAG TPA: CpsD/CapB family tyrosine-protein kinase, partial [Blastocatellia bacterium]|nr:CpsD/CapB family tyrosine-protein kinase [Blastocatellia bacterium]